LGTRGNQRVARDLAVACGIVERHVLLCKRSVCTRPRADAFE
jgi:hypothetical protein